MQTKYIILLAGVVCANLAVAQGYDQDALLVSQTTAMGATARVQGIGGAQVSLGGDISLAGSNPAGLGFFNKSVFSITPSLNFHNADGIYNGRLNTSFKTNVNLPNMGVVLNNTIGDIPNNKFKGGSFAISATRINDFNQQYFYAAPSKGSSIMDSFVEDARFSLDQGSSLSDLAQSAYDTYLIDTDIKSTVVNGQTEEVVVDYHKTVNGSEPMQSESVKTKGGQNQLNFAWGGNYNDQVYFGGGIGVQTIRYKRERYFSEKDFFYSGTNSNYQPLNNIVVSDELSLDGTGINATFGMIVRPVNFLTLGIAYTSPTYFAMRSEYGFNMTADWNNFQYNSETLLNVKTSESPIIATDYNIKTPSKLAVGGTLFLGKKGFISGDVELVDYQSMLLQSADVEVDLSFDNQTILKQYGQVINYKVGAEFRLDDFRFRGGYAYYGDPYKNGTIDRSRSNLTFGAGLRQRDFFVDLAVVRTFFDESYSPYRMNSISDQPMVQINNNNTSVSATVGLNF
jgi:hypothetical protein